MRSWWAPTAIRIAALLALVSCGGGGSLVGNEDSSVTIAFDAPATMDGGAPRDASEDGPTDMVLERGEGEGVVPECVDNDGDGFGFGPS